MTAEYLVCGCPAAAHRSGCDLGLAETIAYEAADAGDVNAIVAALLALTQAGILQRLPDGDPDGVLLGILDLLWQTNLIGAPAREAVQP